MIYTITPGTRPEVVGSDVDFMLTVDGLNQHFRVTHEALKDHFPDERGTANDRLAAFERGKDHILRAAVKKLGTGPVIVVTTFDF